MNSLIKRETRDLRGSTGQIWEMVANYNPVNKIRTHEMVLIMNELINEREKGKLFLIMLTNTYWRNDRILNISILCKHHS